MKKQIVGILCALALCLGLIPAAGAALEPERACSLTLHYTQEGTAFSELDVKIYRVAQMHPNGAEH